SRRRASTSSDERPGGSRYPRRRRARSTRPSASVHIPSRRASRRSNAPEDGGRMACAPAWTRCQSATACSATVGPGAAPWRAARAAPDQLAAPDAHRDVARDRIDVTEQDHVRTPLADLADGVAGPIDVRPVSETLHARDEPLDRALLIARDARDLDEAADEV